jgi:hypothetical protein
MKLMVTADDGQTGQLHATVNVCAGFAISTSICMTQRRHYGTVPVRNYYHSKSNHWKACVALPRLCSPDLEARAWRFGLFFCLVALNLD